ncbi:MAG: hypothetical protein J7J75_01230 [Euryarchaeota archaeon]|nr:hypothetical protein [Euryarchaeota archaeon]
MTMKLRFKPLLIYIALSTLIALVTHFSESLILPLMLESTSFIFARVVLYYALIFIGGLVYYRHLPIRNINFYVATPLFVFSLFIVEFMFGFISASLSIRILYYLTVVFLPIILFEEKREITRKDLSTMLIIYVSAAVVPLLIRMSIPTQYFNYCECWMDTAIFSNAMRIQRLPLEDPWLSGLPMVYYYGGHYGFATLALLSALPPGYGINVASATVLQLLFMAIYGFSLVILREKGVPRARLLSLLIALCLTFGANAYPFVEYLKYLWNGDQNAFNTAIWHLSPAYLIPGTTHHVPMLDFFQKELHANYMMTPFLVTYVWLTYVIKKEGKTPLIAVPYNGFFLPLFTWSWPVVSLYTFALMTNHYGIAIPVLGALMYSPYILTLLGGEGVSGIAFIEPHNTVIPRTPITAIVVYLLPFIIILYSYISVRVLKMEKNYVLRSLLSFLIALPFVFTRYKAMAVLIAPLVFTMLSRDEEKTLKSLLFTSMITIIACDFVYVDDIFAGYWERFNTVFKFYETSWTLLATAVPLLVARLWEIIPKRRPFTNLWRAIKCAFIVSLVLSLTYLPLGYYGSKYKYWDSFDADKFTLDGSMALNIHDRIIVKALLRLPRGVVVELPSPDAQSYVYNGRISVFSGDPSVVGWPLHEYVWRGSIGWHEASTRLKDVLEFYKNPCNETLRVLVEKYHARYIVFSRLEATYVIQNSEKIITIEHWEKTLLSTGHVRVILKIGPYRLFEITGG